MAESAFIMSDLTFIDISFAKIFCQNKVKKNRKYVFLHSPLLSLTRQ